MRTVVLNCRPSQSLVSVPEEDPGLILGPRPQAQDPACHDRVAMWHLCARVTVLSLSSCLPPQPLHPLPVCLRCPPQPWVQRARGSSKEGQGEAAV